MMDALRKEVENHFNEPVLVMSSLGRVVGYAEDDEDCYMIVRYPNPKAHSQYYVSMVGGYTYLDRLNGQNYAASPHTGEEWDDFSRLSTWLELNGCPKEEKFLLEVKYEGN
jgi:hypothetical protein